MNTAQPPALSEGYRRICSTSDVPEGTMTKFDLGDREVMIVNTGGHFYAADTWCTHQRSDLSMGILIDTLVMCPLHQARFDIRDGHVAEGPSGESAISIPPLAIYAVKIEGGDILIKLPA